MFIVVGLEGCLSMLASLSSCSVNAMTWGLLLGAMHDKPASPFCRLGLQPCAAWKGSVGVGRSRWWRWSASHASLRTCSARRWEAKSWPSALRSASTVPPRRCASHPHCRCACAAHSSLMWRCWTACVAHEPTCSARCWQARTLAGAPWEISALLHSVSLAALRITQLVGPTQSDRWSNQPSVWADWACRRNFSSAVAQHTPGDISMLIEAVSLCAGPSSGSRGDGQVAG